eukprot:12353774-Alexandrium_andersonii.AAC.1
MSASLVGSEMCIRDSSSLTTEYLPMWPSPSCGDGTSVDAIRRGRTFGLGERHPPRRMRLE